MLSPIMTLTTVVGQTSYALPEDFLSMLYVQDPTTYEFLEEVPPRMIEEAGQEVPEEGSYVNRFRITQLSGIKAQPSAAGVVVVTPSGGSEAAANGIVVQGLDANGNWIEETLSSGSSWASLTSSNSFLNVTNIIKTGATWTRTITVTVGLVTLLSLTSSQTTKQYTMLELPVSPTQASTLRYRYYRKPVDLVYDYQLPQIPEAYGDILEYEALKLLPGFTKPDGAELSAWIEHVEDLKAGLAQNYQNARSLGGRVKRVRSIERI